MWRYTKKLLPLMAGIIVALFLVQHPTMLLSTTSGFQTPEPVPRLASFLSPNQLDDLVAPVALYPDPLLSQVLVACTYPLEIVEASRNR